MVFLPGMCAIVKLNCITWSQALHNGGGLIFVWKNLVTVYLFVRMITGCGAPQNISSNSLNAEKIARLSFAGMDIFSCEGVKVLVMLLEQMLSLKRYISVQDRLL